MIDLGSWMNKIFIGWGVDFKIVNIFDEMIIVILMIFIVVGLDYFCQVIFVGGMKCLVWKIFYKWDILMVKYKVIYYLIYIFFGILMYMFFFMVFVYGKMLLLVLQKICVIYMIFVLLLVFNSSLLMLLDIFSVKEKLKDWLMKGFIQVLQVFVFFIGGIVIVVIIVDKFFVILFVGLGVFVVILMLVFKDSILGFVVGIQLLVNDMICFGDWVIIFLINVNGIVEEIILNMVKIQNFDNIIFIVFFYLLVNGLFQNWWGMMEFGGCWVMKSIFFDLIILKFCIFEMFDIFWKEIFLLVDYQLEEGVIFINLQVFRVYVECYFCSLFVVNQDFDLIIS